MYNKYLSKNNVEKCFVLINLGGNMKINWDYIHEIIMNFDWFYIRAIIAVLLALGALGAEIGDCTCLYKPFFTFILKAIIPVTLVIGLGIAFGLILI